MRRNQFRRGVHPDGVGVQRGGPARQRHTVGWTGDVYGMLEVLARYRPDGSVDRSIKVPVRRPTSCAFGGPGLRTLFVTTTSQGMSEAELDAEPLAGALLALDPGVPGLPEPRWAGASVLAEVAP